MKGMATCKVCGRDFALIVEDHYVANDPQKIGALANVINTDRAFEFDAFDCPYCGCQNVMQERKPTQDECPCDFGICDECDHVGESETGDHDGCHGCLYEDKQTTEYPCNKCKGNYMDMYEKGSKE